MFKMDPGYTGASNSTLGPSVTNGNFSENNSYMEYDYSDYPYPNPLRVIPWWEICLKIFFYILIITVALVGNTLVILVVIRDKRMRTTTNFYIVNLATSDLLVALSCAWVHLVDSLTENWVLGPFFCKFNSFAQVLSLVASILTLTLIACDRFFGIVFAMKAHIIERRARYSIVLVWLCSAAVALPMLFYRQMGARVWADHTETWCNDEWPVIEWVDPDSNVTMEGVPSRTLYYTFVSVVLYFIPVVVMTVAYTVIIVKLWSSRAPGEKLHSDTTQERVRKRVVMMLVAILSMFVLCWMPFNVCLLYAEHRPQQTVLGDWFTKFHYFSLYLAYSNSAFNPLIYAGFNEKFRKGFKVVIGIYKRERRYSAVVSHQDTSISTTMMTKV